MNFSLLIASLIISLLLVEFLFHLPLPIFESIFDKNKNTADWYYMEDNKKIFLTDQSSIDFEPIDHIYLYHGFVTCGNTGLNFCNIEICNNLEKKSNVYRVVFIGDSVTNAIGYGKVSNPNSIFTGIIKDELRKISKKDLQFEVFNFGFGGANIEDISDYFKDVVGCKPDLTIYLFIQNDLMHRWSFQAEPYAKYKYSDKWLHRTRLFYFFSSSISNILFYHYNNYELDYKIAEESLNQITSYNNSKFFIVDLPYLDEGFKKETDFVKLYSDKFNIDYLDLRDVFIEKNLNPFDLRPNTFDYVHLGYKGHEIVAEVIYQKLFENNSIPINKT